MDPAEDVVTGKLDALLTDLDEPDTELRDIHRKLAADPDRVTEYETRRAELHIRRLQLAQRVGLAVLARRKAAPVASVESPLVVTEAGAVAAEDGPSPSPDPPLHSETPAPPPPDRASDTDLAQWKDSVRTTGFGAGIRLAPSDSTVRPLVLHDLMGIVGPPRNLQTGVDAIEEAEALDAVATDPRRQLD